MITIRLHGLLNDVLDFVAISVITCNKRNNNQKKIEFEKIRTTFEVLNKMKCTRNKSVLSFFLNHVVYYSKWFVHA